jgi:hypothetical protein
LDSAPGLLGNDRLDLAGDDVLLRGLTVESVSGNLR